MDARTLTYTGIALVTWSSAYAAIAVALQHFTPGEIAFGRLAIAALCFSVLIVARRVPLPQRSDWLRIGVLGVLGLTVYQLCLNQAETRISSGTAAILIALAPAATTTLSAVWIGERISGQRIAGLAVALAGVVMVVLSSGGHLKLEPMALLVLVSVAVSAVFFVAQKPLFARNSLVGVTGMGFVAAALGALPFGVHLPSSVSSAPMAPLLALVWLGVAPTFVGYLAWNAALTRVSASRLSTAIYFSAPLAVLIGWAWLGEKPGWLTLIGGVVVVGGVVLANARRKLAAPVVLPVETECCD